METQDSASLADGQQVITACAFIHHDFDGVTKVFLPKRAASKKFLPGVVELPGGHIEFGEDIVEGLKREILEELKMSVAVGDPFAVFTYQNDVKKSHSIEVIYFATFRDDVEHIQLNPDDHSSYGWYSRKDILKIYTPEKGADDVEFKAIIRGFELLEGARPRF